MSSESISSLSHQDLRRVFQQAFSVEDLARPLLSFDESTAAELVVSVLRKRNEEYAGVRVEGVVVGFVAVNELGQGPCARFARPFLDSQTVGSSLSLAELVLKLKQDASLFVTALGQVSGVVGRTDFLKPPARMWLFGMITLLELRFGRMIELHCPDSSWKRYLSEGRIQKAELLQAERARRGREPDLLDCLQFSDKTQIMARCEQLRSLTLYASKRQVEDVGRRLEMLRNGLAHAQDIVTDDWDTIVSLAENFDVVVTNPG